MCEKDNAVWMIYINDIWTSLWYIYIFEIIIIVTIHAHNFWMKLQTNWVMVLWFYFSFVIWISIFGRRLLLHVALLSVGAKFLRLWSKHNQRQPKWELKCQPFALHKVSFRRQDNEIGRQKTSWHFLA